MQELIYTKEVKKINTIRMKDNLKKNRKTSFRNSRALNIVINLARLARPSAVDSCQPYLYYCKDSKPMKRHTTQSRDTRGPIHKARRHASHRRWGGVRCRHAVKINGTIAIYLVSHDNKR